MGLQPLFIQAQLQQAPLLRNMQIKVKTTAWYLTNLPTQNGHRLTLLALEILLVLQEIGK